MFVHQVEVDIKIHIVLHPTQSQLVRPLSILNEIIDSKRYQNIYAKQQESIPVGCLPPACWPYVLQYPATRCQHWWGTMGLYREGTRALCRGELYRGRCPVWRRALYKEGPVHGGLCTKGALYRGSLYGEVQCIMGNGHMWLLLWTERQTDRTENITFQQLHWWAVTTNEKNYLKHRAPKAQIHRSY